MDTIFTLMAIVGKLVDFREASEDNTERMYLHIIIEAFESYIEHKTQQWADTIETPEDFNAAMYQMTEMQKDTEIVEAIWIPDPDEMPGGFSIN